MHNFKTVFSSTLTFAVILVTVLSILFVPYKNSDTNDSKYRKELAGTLDTVYCGSSHGHFAFDTRVIDPILGTSSYNLSDGQMSMRNINLLVKKEISRNPIKTVVIEIHKVAFNDMTPDAEAEGETYFISRLDTLKEKVRYLFDSGIWINFDKILSLKVNGAIRFWRGKIFGGEASVIDRSLKGVILKEAVNLEAEEREKVSNTDEKEKTDADVKETLNEEYISLFDDIVSFCHEKNIEIFVVITPVSDILLTTYDDYDGDYKWFYEHCKKIDCRIYDFNLFKTKSELFSDVTSFYDYGHLSRDGSAVFSKLFAETMLKERKGENTDELFYSSYDEAMPYNKWNIYLNMENN